jgi:hypothetical protein
MILGVAIVTVVDDGNITRSGLHRRRPLGMIL